MSLPSSQTERPTFGITVKFKVRGPGHTDAVERAIRNLSQIGIDYEIVSSECELEHATMIRQR